MIHSLILDDEIDLWWELPFGKDGKITFKVFEKGNEVAEIEKTHYEFENLSPETDYTYSVQTFYNGVPEGAPETVTLTTKAKKNRINVTEAPYFAIGDGVTLNTKALQAAIDACTPNDAVYFPAGIFLTGSLSLHSDTELFIDKGTVLQGSTDFHDYLPKVQMRFEGYERECYSPLLNIGVMDNKAGCTERNIMLRGGGAILGGGRPLCDGVIEYENERLQEYIKSLGDKINTFEKKTTLAGRYRPFLINANNTDGVVITRLKVGYGAAWNLHQVYSKNILISFCEIVSKGVWNGDGWDPDSSDHCVMYGCTFDTHDDAVAIKSGKNPEGDVIARPCTDVRIFDCHGTHGFALGSEMSGGIEDVYVWQNDIGITVRGFRIKTTRKRGGYVRNVRVSECSFPVVWIDSDYNCNDDGEPSPNLPTVSDLHFEKLSLTGVTLIDTRTDAKVGSAPIKVVGIEEHPFHDISFRDITVDSNGVEGVPAPIYNNVEGLTVLSYRKVGEKYTKNT